MTTIICGSVITIIIIRGLLSFLSGHEEERRQPAVKQGGALVPLVEVSGLSLQPFLAQVVEDVPLARVDHRAGGAGECGPQGGVPRWRREGEEERPECPGVRKGLKVAGDGVQTVLPHLQDPIPEDDVGPR